MADNPVLDLAQTVMIEKYGLSEIDYSIVSFTDGAKNVTIKMSDGNIPVQASFPREFLRYEEMKRWTEAKKEQYVRYLLQENNDIPDELVDSFHNAMIRVELNPTNENEVIRFEAEEGEPIVIKMVRPSVDDEEDDKEEDYVVGVDLANDEDSTAYSSTKSEGTFVEKTEGKKARKKLAKKK
jgi:hypothetical protein